MPEHNTLTDPNLHEPVGISTAVANKVYRSDGAGSGDWVYPAGEGIGELFISLGTTSQTLNAVAGTYDKFNPGTEWTDGTARVVTLDSTNGDIVLTRAGTYSVDFWISFDTAAVASGAKYFFKYAIDGVVSTRILSIQKNTAGVDRLHCAAHGIVTVTAGQKLSMYVAGDATSAGTTITAADSGIVAILQRES